MKKEEKVIMYESPEAARFVTDIKGWVDKDNRFWGTDEHMARWSGCTHMLCECGNVKVKNYTKCDTCLDKARIERYNARPFKEWDQDSFVFSEYTGQYFANSDEIDEYLDDAEDVKPSDLMLVLGEPNEWRQINSDYWEDIIPEDSEGELPKELQDDLNNLNKIIDSLPPASYSPGKYRTEYAPHF